MSQVPHSFEVIDDRMADVLRQKTGAERLAIADGMFNFAREMILTRLHDEHPDWPEEQILAETARRLSHGAI